MGEKHCFTRKNELVYHKVYETRNEAIKDVVRYIEIFYNRQRIQKGLGFKSPAGVSKTFIVRLPDEIYQVFYSVVASRGHLRQDGYFRKNYLIISQITYLVVLTVKFWHN